MRIKKLSLSLILFMIILFGMSYSFAGSGELRFDQSSVDVRLYCTTPVVNVIVSGDIYNSYTADIPFINGITFANPNQTAVTAFGSKTMNNGVCGSLSQCLRFVGSKDNGMLNGGNNGGTLTIQNSGYIRSNIINITGYRQSVQSVVSSGLVDYTTVNGLLSLFSLNISLYPAPCNSDTSAPTFGFTGGMTPHITNYTGPQFNDRIYAFNLTDMGGINDYGFFSGYTDDWSPDRTGGTYYSTGPTVLNGSGIDLATFVFQVGVETNPDSSSFSSITLTGTYNIIGASAITGSTGGLVFYPYGFIWNRQNRNYTGYLLTGNLWPDSFLDIDNKWSFGTEKEVIMTGYVYDRANLVSNTFAIHFNYGAVPRSSIQASGVSQVGCGPAGSTSISITAPTSDSGAYIVKTNDGYVLQPFKVYLQDDWAGIDTGTITVYLSGTQGGSWTGITLTVSNPEISITSFAWVGPISVVTAGNGTQSIYNTTNQNRNYETLVNYAGKRDPETKVEVSIDYKDLVGRTGNQMSCSYANSYAPYANNWTDDVHLERYPYANGGQLSGLQIKIEDERAGVDSGTITLAISGREVTDIPNRTTSAKLISLAWAELSGWSAPYTTHSTIISGGQNYNYTITIPDNAGWGGYFAPEHPIDITITYTDLAGNIQTATKQYTNLDAGSYGTLYNNNIHTTSYTNTNYFLIDISENPFLTVFDSTVNVINTYPEWFDAFPIRTFANGYTGGISQYSGMQFGIFDYRAGVDGGYNFVKIIGTRRGSTVTYVFATDDSTGTTWTDWTNCTVANNCITGTMIKVAVLETGYDAYHAQHPTLQQSTGYTFQISSNHGIYFDYGIYGSTGTYDVDVYLSDMRPDDPNDLVESNTLNMDSLACQFLDRCSHDMLTFVWGSGADVGETVIMNPLTGAIDNPFGGSRVSIIGSGVLIDTGTSIVYCTASEGLIDNPITLDFTQAPNLTGVSTGSYQSPILKVADGLFELTGASNDQLIVR